MWIRQEDFENLCYGIAENTKAIREQIEGALTHARLLGSFIDIMKADNKAFDLRLDGIERSLMQYAEGSKRMVEAAKDLTMMHDDLVLRIAALQAIAQRIEVKR